MVIEFFKKNKSAKTHNPVASIDYLLNERVEKGTARVLQGDEKFTRDILKNMTQKNKASVGCLSFEEKNISEQAKFKIMRSFEKAMFPNLESRVNILWVEHTDKNRLELNFVIPKIDLTTKTSFNPYFVDRDFDLIDKWQELVNLKYNLSSGKNPEKSRMFVNNDFDISNTASYEKLAEKIAAAAAKGVFKNRDDLIAKLEKKGIEVTRKTSKKSLSLKLKNTKKARRFDDFIFTSAFKNADDLKNHQKEKEKAIKEYKERDKNEEFKKLKNDFKILLKNKTLKVEEEFKKKDEAFIKRRKREEKKQDKFEELVKKSKTTELKDERFTRNAIDRIRKSRAEREEKRRSILSRNRESASNVRRKLENHFKPVLKRVEKDYISKSRVEQRRERYRDKIESIRKTSTRNSSIINKASEIVRKRDLKELKKGIDNLKLAYRIYFRSDKVLDGVKIESREDLEREKALYKERKLEKERLENLDNSYDIDI